MVDRDRRERRIGRVEQQPRHDRDAEPAPHERLHLAQVVRADARDAQPVVGERGRERALAGGRAVLADQVAAREVGRGQRPPELQQRVAGRHEHDVRIAHDRLGLEAFARLVLGRDDEVELARGQAVEQLSGK